MNIFRFIVHSFIVNPNVRVNFDLFSSKVSFDDVSNVTATEALWLEPTILSLAAVNHPAAAPGGGGTPCLANPKRSSRKLEFLTLLKA
jgi:hypothetical protein